MELLFDSLGVILILFVFCMAIFLVIRELLLWYWKVNKQIALQEKTNMLLQQILDQQNIKPAMKTLSSNGVNNGSLQDSPHQSLNEKLGKQRNTPY